MNIRKEIIHQVCWGLFALWPLTFSAALLAFFELIVAIRSLPPELFAWISTIGWGCIYVLCAVQMITTLAILLEIAIVYVCRLKRGGAQ